MIIVKMKACGKKLKIVFAVCILITAVFLYFIINSRFLTVSDYSLEVPLSSGIRIVYLSDLHNAEFGENNKKLIEQVASQNPDIIFMTGDMINREEADLTVIKNLISALSDIAPIYYCYGNHEVTWEDSFNCDLHEELADCGAVVLNNEFVDIDINSNAVRIGGYMGYYWQPHMMTKDTAQQQLERVFYSDFQNTERYKILLNHIPTQWLDWGYINKCNVDLVFSGHYHGGVIRLPIIDRGLFAPYVGWFPPYTKGVYVGTEATCVISAGLGSEHAVPRINNPPEIVVVDLIPTA